MKLILFVFIYLLNCCYAAPKPLRFLVIGDWGSVVDTTVEDKENQYQVASVMAKTAEERPIDFVISSGDNFYKTGVWSLQDPRWLQDFTNVYNATSLQVPWYTSLGNHDYEGIVKYQLEFKEDKKWNMPDRNYTVTFPLDGSEVTFVFIDTSPFVQSYYKNPETPEQGIQLSTQHWKEQLNWLTETMAKIKSPWIIVVGHHPVYTTSVDIDTKELIKNIEPLLIKYNAPYFDGHEHNLQHVSKSGIDYYVSGGGSRIVPVYRNPAPGVKIGFGEPTTGFVFAQLTAKSLEVEYIAGNGTTLYTTIRNKTK